MFTLEHLLAAERHMREASIPTFDGYCCCIAPPMLQLSQCEREWLASYYERIEP